jgi:hypothetical protein
MIVMIEVYRDRLRSGVSFVIQEDKGVTSRRLVDDGLYRTPLSGLTRRKFKLVEGSQTASTSEYRLDQMNPERL